MKAFALCMVLAAGCGRSSFDPLADARPDAPPFGPQFYIKASNPGNDDRFGGRVALSADGNTLAVGAANENGGAPGIDGNQADESKADAGAVYVFARAAGSWVQQGYIKAAVPDAGDYFGITLALSVDGSTLAVGAYFEASAAAGINGTATDNSAPAAGAAYVFTRSGATWSQQAYIKASNPDSGDVFGGLVVLSGDGDTLAVSAPYENSGAQGVGGNQLDNSASNAGAVYIFTRSGVSWTQQAYIKASNAEAEDVFGEGIQLSDDGSTLAVCARHEDSAATGVGGSQLDNSALDSGAVYVFTRSGVTWTQQAYLKDASTAALDDFGYATAMSGSGSMIVVGAYHKNSVGVDAGELYSFTRTGTTWTAQPGFLASNTEPGDGLGIRAAVSRDGQTLAANAYREASAATGIDGDQTDNSAPMAGAVYLFRSTGPSWSQVAYVKAPNTGAGDDFGSSVALSADGSVLAVGAGGESSGGADPLDNSVSQAGAVYIFE